MFIDDSEVDLETRMRLLSLSRIGDPEVLILAAAAGDFSTMRNFLQEAPDKVFEHILIDIYNMLLVIAGSKFHLEKFPLPSESPP